ncbi:MAG: hypothetical protein R3246_08825 [Acidimicrobiia bacterium]|nr:hypothetical protein [Acidimicrobiia bacterium]
MPDLLERHTFAYRHPLSPFITNFTVLVVDGSGNEVAGEPVTVSFDDDTDSRRTIQTVTDRAGRARLHTTHDVEPHHVFITAAGEATGPLRPAPGAIVVIEA